MVNENSSVRSLDKKALVTRMMIGGALNLTLMGIFLYGGGPGKPEWGNYWIIRPLLVATFSGLCGGAVFYFFTHYLKPKGAMKVFAYAGSAIIYFIGFWMGMVLGLVGTWWD